MIITDGMRQHAQGDFPEQDIQVVVEASAETPEKLVSNYLA